MTNLEPKPINEKRIEFLISKRIDPNIASIDLEMVKMKLRQPEEYVDWTKEQVEDAEIEYKRYLTLCRRFPSSKYSIVPNKIMDQMWHYHILDTRAYIKDSQFIFGGYFHHYPYFGLRSEEDKKNLIAAFEQTKLFYEEAFCEKMARSSQQNCWNDCESRCWHACSSIKVPA